MDERRPLSSGLAGCCKSARLGGGLPESQSDSGGLTPRPWLPPDMLRLVDVLARRLEREERLRAMYGGELCRTLISAARAGGLRDVRFLLAAGADANFRNGTPLNVAAGGGHVAVMAALLSAGACGVDEALICAATYNQVPAAALLLARGANIHHGDNLALRWAAGNGHFDMVAFLLDNGADLDAENGDALRRAQQNSHAAVVALLLERARV